MTGAPAIAAPYRVVLHLAENPHCRERPFAFLATVQATESGPDALHVPLGRWLQGSPASGAAVLADLRRAASACPELRHLLHSGALLTPQRWSVREASQFLRAMPSLETTGVSIRVPAWWTRDTRRRVTVRVSLGLRSTGHLSAQDLIGVDVALVCDGQALHAEEVERVLAADGGLIQLRGRWTEVDSKALQTLLNDWQATRRAIAGTGLSFVRGMRLMLGGPVPGPDGHPHGPVHGTSTERWQEVVARPELAALVDTLHTPSAAQLSLDGLHATLRDYQRHGVAWLAALTHLGLGACLADDMGLGKTLQALALLVHRRACSEHPSLVVLPTSLLPGWQAEAHRFAPGLRVGVAHPSARDETAWQQADVVLTTYAMLDRRPELAATRWDVVIFDEAQALKSPHTVRARAARALEASSRVLLTGTPVENRLEDLWALFDLINPGLLGTLREFQSFVQLLDGDHAPLQALVAPYLLRREKSDPRIAPELPPKTVMPTACILTPGQAALYQAEVDRLTHTLATVEAPHRSGAVLAAITRFKLICNHPALLDPHHDPTTADLTASSKLLALQQLAEPLVGSGDRLLVFTQYRRTIPLLERTLEAVWGRPGLTLHGALRVEAREQVVRDFQRPEGPPFLVVSLRAGGTGLTLTAAQHVVHFDRWWNPAVEAQATDRTHRIGQHRPVWVHPFTCRGTVEERVDQLLQEKQSLADGVVEAGSAPAFGAMSADELLALVRLDLYAPLSTPPSKGSHAPA